MRLGSLIVCCALPALASTAGAAVEREAAARLGTVLTPLGGERLGNAAGTIPAWTGVPAGPAADEAPVLLVTRDNAGRHADVLSDGQRALIDALPESYAMPVYATRREAGAPPPFLAGTARNALHTTLGAEAAPPQDAVAGIPFPILSTDANTAGLESIWNHRLRWRGLARTRPLTQITSSTRGDLAITRLRERLRFQPIDAAPTPPYGVLLGFALRGVFEPKRLAGSVKLVYDPLQGAPVAWQRVAGQRLVRTTSAGDDTPVIGAEGLFNEDQAEGFAGSPARYQWKRLGGRELLVPYDADRFEGAVADDIFGPRHIRPERARYERHRVHVVEARLKPTLIAPFARRVFYLDEDSWQVLLVELYDRSDRLVRVQEVHTRVGADGALLPTLEAAYDLPGRRYFAVATTQGDGRAEFDEIAAKEFEPDRAMRWARHSGIMTADDHEDR